MFRWSFYRGWTSIFHWKTLSILHYNILISLKWCNHTQVSHISCHVVGYSSVHYPSLVCIEIRRRVGNHSNEKWRWICTLKSIIVAVEAIQCNVTSFTTYLTLWNTRSSCRWLFIPVITVWGCMASFTTNLAFWYDSRFLPWILIPISLRWTSFGMKVPEDPEKPLLFLFPPLNLGS